MGFASGSVQMAGADVRPAPCPRVWTPEVAQRVAPARILVMDGGCIVESGAHRELLDAAGRYAQLFARWSAGE